MILVIRRLLSFIADFFLISISIFFLSRINIIGYTFNFEYIFWFFLALSFALFDYLYEGKTPGKFLFLIKVENQANEPISFTQSISRSLFIFILPMMGVLILRVLDFYYPVTIAFGGYTEVFFLFFLFSIASLLYTNGNESFHDYFFNTRVVPERQRVKKNRHLSQRSVVGFFIISIIVTVTTFGLVRNVLFGALDQTYARLEQEVSSPEPFDKRSVDSQKTSEPTGGGNTHIQAFITPVEKLEEISNNLPESYFDKRDPNLPWQAVCNKIFLEKEKFFDRKAKDQLVEGRLAEFAREAANPLVIVRLHYYIRILGAYYVSLEEMYMVGGVLKANSYYYPYFKKGENSFNLSFTNESENYYKDLTATNCSFTESSGHKPF